jgi:uncharacterized protein (TIGR04255 family)
MTYRRAPVTEALIDIRVQAPSEIALVTLEAIKTRVPDYPRQEQRTLAEAQVNFGSEITTTTQQKRIGYAYFSSDGKQVFQARMDGFTFSRLEPYQSWNALSNEARRLWDIYRDYIKPIKITRVAVRFINQFNFPGDKVEPELYLNTYANISDKLKDELRQIGPFLMSLRLPQNDLRGWMVLNEALGPQKSPGTVPIILDFDLFVENPDIPSEDGLWTLLERLRERKNIYFEACITDKTRELIS